MRRVLSKAPLTVFLVCSPGRLYHHTQEYLSLELAVPSVCISSGTLTYTALFRNSWGPVLARSGETSGPGGAGAAVLSGE